MSFKLCCSAFCGEPIILPERGPLPSERPRPNRKLVSDIRCSVRTFVVMAAISFFFIFPSLIRRRWVGVLLDVGGCTGALIGLYGTLSLRWTVIAASLIIETVAITGFLAFVLSNYAGSIAADDPFAYVVLAVYLPDIALDVITLLLALPPFCRLYALSAGGRMGNSAAAAASQGGSGNSSVLEPVVGVPVTSESVAATASVV